MPFKSKSQQRFMFAKHPKMAEEFASATPDMKALPEKAPKNMADGGDASQAPTMGEENPILAFLRSKLMANNAPIAAEQNEVNQALGIDQPNINTSDGQFMGNLTAGTTAVPMPTPNMAVGGDISQALSRLISPINALGAPVQAAADAVMPGDSPNYMQGAAEKAAAPLTPQPWMQDNSVDQDFINKLNQGMDTGPMPSQTPAQPSMSMAAQNAQNMPSTPVDPNQGISAADRAALYQHLLAQKTSPGGLVASGLAGLGDAISNSFGKGGATYQKQVGENFDKSREAGIAGMDTERKQKLEDIQAKSEAALNDPQSSLSQSMRKTLIASGVQVPSGMSGALMLKVAGPLAEMAKAKATQEETHFGHELGAAEKGAQLTEEQKKLEAEHPFQRLLGMLPGQSPSHPMVGQDFNGAKITNVRQVK